MGKSGGGRKPPVFSLVQIGLSQVRGVRGETRRGEGNMRDLSRGRPLPGRLYGGGTAAPLPPASAQPCAPRVWEAAFGIGRHAQKILQESTARIRYVQLPGLG